MKLNYKRLILWILFIITFINLISTHSIYEIISDDFYKSKNILSLFISGLNFIKHFLKELPYFPFFLLIIYDPRGLPLLFASWIIFILFPILRIMSKNLSTPFILMWLIINYTIIILLYKKLNLSKKTFIKIILYLIIIHYLFLCSFDFIPYQFSTIGEIAAMIYLIYFICSWLGKIIEKLLNKISVEC